MKESVLFFWAGILLLFLPACGSNSTSSEGGGGGGGPQRYDLTTSVSPADAGSVDPSSGTYDDGDTVEVKASASEGWEFTDWTGDLSSTDNPFSFTITSDTDLTANFKDISSKYAVELTAKDSLDSISLELGQKEGATDAFDENIDAEAPPPPPDGALHAYLLHEGKEYFKDYRSHGSKEVLWNLQYQAGSGDTLSLSWSITETKLEGALELSDADNSFSVDMLQNSTYSFRATDHDSLLITYTF